MVRNNPGNALVCPGLLAPMVSSTGCVVHVVVGGEWVVLWVATTLLQLGVAGMVS